MSSQVRGSVVFLLCVTGLLALCTAVAQASPLRARASQCRNDGGIPIATNERFFCLSANALLWESAP